MNKHKENSTHQHSPLKHLAHMILCCGLPLLIILSLPYIATLNSRFATILGTITPFICPIMMFGMMFMMFRNGKKENCCEKIKKEN
jgi:hypothetical protein